MRGFVVTLLAITLVAILVAYASILHAEYLALERVLEEPRPLMYASMLFDSAASGVNSIAGPAIAFEPRNDSLRIMLGDSMPKENFTSDLGSFAEFLEDETAGATNSAIHANFSNITPENVEVLLAGRYRYKNEGDEIGFTAPGGTGALAYEIFVVADAPRGSISTLSFDPGGDLNLTFTYTDQNGTIMQSGTLRSSGLGVFAANFSGGGSMEASVGKIHGDDGAVSISAHGISADCAINATLPPLSANERAGYEYDAWMDYAQGRISLGRMIGK